MVSPLSQPVGHAVHDALTCDKSVTGVVVAPGTAVVVGAPGAAGTVVVVLAPAQRWSWWWR